MQTQKTIRLIIATVLLFNTAAYSQKSDSVWTLKKCIDYALQHNISVQKYALNSQASLETVEKAKAARFPSLNAQASQNFSWGKELDMQTNEYGNFSESNSTQVGVNSNLILYNGFRTENTIKQSKLQYDASVYEIQTIKESISLNVLDAYLQVLYAGEQVKNSQKQLESTTQQVTLANERYAVGALAKSDFLLVRSQLASEQLTVTNAQNLKILRELTLMQLMEFPTTDSFAVEYPSSEETLVRISEPLTDSVYATALNTKPQIKSSELYLQQSDIAIAIAKSAYQPTLSLSAGVSTAYASGSALAYDYQMQNHISPSVGLTLSIPIYQNRQAKTSVNLAKIERQTTELTVANTKNTLRKEVEQACANAKAAEKEFEASKAQLAAIQEAYTVAQEKFAQGMLSSTDFITQKTNLISAESSALQAKYNLIFSYLILDFYEGKPLSL